MFKLKLDGYRALAIKSGGKVRLCSRNDNDFTARYPLIAKALATLTDETVIDGELVAFDALGRRSIDVPHSGHDLDTLVVQAQECEPTN